MWWIKELRSFFEKHNIEKKLLNLNLLIERPNFWNNRIEAEKILKEKKNYDILVSSLKKFNQEEKDLYDIFILAKEENNIQFKG